MKIVSIGPANPLRGGIARFNESFSYAMKRIGTDVEIFSFSYLYPGFLFPGKTQFNNGSSSPDLVIRSKLHPLNPFNWKNVAADIVSAAPDLVVFHYWMPFFAPAYRMLARSIRKKINVPLIVIAHNLVPHENQPLTLFLARSFLKNVDGVVTLSSFVLRDLNTLIKGMKGISLPHPVYDDYGEKTSREAALSKLGLEDGCRYLLFFGLVRNYKGLDILLDALKFVKGENYKLLIAGEFYDSKQKYLKQIIDNNLSDKAIIRDEYIPDEDVRYYFSLADIVVQPYKSATQSGITQIAYHFDCPMLVTNVGGLSEAVVHKKSGYVVNVDAKAIAEAIDEFLISGNKNEFVACIQQEKKRLSWDIFANNFLKFTASL